MPTATDLGREFSKPLSEISPAVESLLGGCELFQKLQREVASLRAAGDHPVEADAPLFVMHHRERWQRLQQAQPDNLALAQWQPRSEWAGRLLSAAKCLLDIRDVADYALARVELCRDILAKGVIHVQVPPFDKLRNGLLLVRGAMEWETLGLTRDGFLEGDVRELSPHLAPTLDQLRKLTEGLETAEWPHPASLVLHPEKYVYPEVRELFIALGDCLIDGGVVARAIDECRRIIGITDVARAIAGEYHPPSLSSSRALYLLEHREARWVCEAFDEYHVAINRYWMSLAKVREIVARARPQLEMTRDTSGVTADQVLRYVTDGGVSLSRSEVDGFGPPLDDADSLNLRMWLTRVHELGEQIKHLAFAQTAVGAGKAPSLAQIVPQDPRIERRGENRFVQIGMYWEVVFQGVEAHVPHVKGMTFLRELLEKPGVAIIDLCTEKGMPDDVRTA